MDKSDKDRARYRMRGAAAVAVLLLAEIAGLSTDARAFGKRGPYESPVSTVSQANTPSQRSTQPPARPGTQPKQTAGPTPKTPPAPANPPASANRRAPAAQRPLAAQPAPPNRQPSRRSPRSRRRSMYRLALAPDMFGDGILATSLTTATAGVSGTLIAPARNKIADNGSALPRDRVYFDYRLFHNAFDISSIGRNASEDVSRYLIGVEKVFGPDDDWSVEMRLPFISGANASAPIVPPGSIDSDGVGNLSVIVKRVLARRDDFVVSAGLAVSTPTGEDSSAIVVGAPIVVRNEAVHLMPWLGFLTVPGDRTFVQGFAQFDVAANGNQVVGAAGTGGRLDNPAVLYLDLEGGYWLIPRDPSNSSSVGLASVLELHYSGTLERGDSVTAGFPTISILANRRFHSVNLTVGTHLALGDNVALRTGMSIPLTTRQHRFFDTETMATLILKR